MRNGIREFQPRQPLDRQLGATTLNQILRELESLRITRVVNGTFRKLPGGTEITVAPQRGGGTSTTTARPFQLSVVDVSETETPEWKVRVLPSTLAGGSSTDLGFALADDPPYLLTASEGIVQGGITINTSGQVTARWIEIVEELDAGNSTTAYVEIGTVQALEGGGFSVSNSRYGPINANICRNWFSSPPTYGVSWLD
jgi:hypothetical protein